MFGDIWQPFILMAASSAIYVVDDRAAADSPSDVLSYSMTGTPDNSPLASLAHTNSDIHALELDLP